MITGDSRPLNHIATWLGDWTVHRPALSALMALSRPILAHLDITVAALRADVSL